jgi:hypothetical protein
VHEVLIGNFLLLLYTWAAADQRTILIWISPSVAGSEALRPPCVFSRVPSVSVMGTKGPWTVGQEFL